MSEDMLHFSKTDSEQAEPVKTNERELWETAPAAPMAPETPKTPAKLHRRRSDQEEDIRETGRSLAAARQKCGLTLEQVAADTRIKLDHLKALEAGRLADLPQLIYVLAYVSKLGKLYNIPEEQLVELRAPLRDITYEIPENLPRMLDVDPSEENKVVLRRMVIIFFCAVTLLVLALLAGGAVLILGHRGTSNPDALPENIGEEQLLQLQDTPQLAIPPAPRKQ